MHAFRGNGINHGLALAVATMALSSGLPIYDGQSVIHSNKTKVRADSAERMASAEAKRLRKQAKRLHDMKR